MTWGSFQGERTGLRAQKQGESELTSIVSFWSKLPMRLRPCFVPVSIPLGDLPRNEFLLRHGRPW